MAGPVLMRQPREEHKVLQARRDDSGVAGADTEGPMAGTVIQPKLKIGAPDDEYEREADEVADRVMRMADVDLSRTAGTGGASGQTLLRQPMEEEEEEEIQAKRVDGPNVVGAEAATVIGRLQGGGRPLAAPVRSFFEQRLGADFSRVRIHDGADAQAATRAVNARAFTLGHDVAFSSGEFAPGTLTGRRLLAHELAHVIQQGAAPTARGRSHASPRIQRRCGPEEVTDAESCAPVTGDIFGTPFLFNVNCDTFQPNQREALAEAGADIMEAGARTDVHGFASAEGPPAFNRTLSCARAMVAAEILEELGVPVDMIYSHGPVEGAPEERRSVVLYPRSVPEPTPVPTPTPAPTRAPCSMHELVVAFLNPGETRDPSLPFLLDPNFYTDTGQCLCEAVKLYDIAESIVALFRSQGEEASAFGLMDAADLICNLWDLAQMVYDAGTDGGPCWSGDNISTGDVARISAFAVSIGVDLGGQAISGLVVGLVAPEAEAAAAEAGGQAGFAVGGPVGALIAAIVAWIAARSARQKFVELGDLLLDLLTYLGQNQLTHGTFFPIDACRSCGRIPAYLGGPDLSGYCDDINAAIPESVGPIPLRFPGLHGSAPETEETE